MHAWLNSVVALSVAGSSMFILYYGMTVISREALTARWYYWNRKLALFFFLVPVFLLLNVPLLLKKNHQPIEGEQLLFVQQNTVWLTENFVQILFIIWLVGAIVASGWFLFMYQSGYRKLYRNLIPVPKDHEVWKILAQQQRNMKLKNRIRLTYCQENISPILIGLFKPTIVLPMYEIPNDELALILKHELIHYKKKDLWVKRLGIFAIILHWYNPLIYLLQKELTKWCELSCDEYVVMPMSLSERKKYAETILNMMQRAQRHSLSPFSAPFFTTGKMKLKKRLQRMLTDKKVSRPIGMSSIVILFIFSGVSIVSSEYTHNNISPIEEEVLTLTEESFDTSIEEEGHSELISVKLSDESKFSKEEWKIILKKIERNEIILEEE